MREKQIRRLIKIVEESNIGELVITRWGTTIRISKTPSNSHATVAVPSNAGPQTSLGAGGASAPAEAKPAKENGEATKSAESPPATESTKIIEIRSPMVGTFYRAPAPDADPYVEVNQVVSKGQVLCLIEAMKLMNEIESEHSGRIVEILVENGQPVEYNQPLFRLEPV